MVRLLQALILAAGMVGLLAPRAGATLPADPAARAAVEKGVAALKRLQSADGTWPHNESGATALAGLTLLECDVPVSDPAVRKAAAAVRGTALNITTTYSLALAILFLDRLGEPVDGPLIEVLGVRLLLCQTKSGGWSYAYIPAADENEVAKLKEILKDRTQLYAKQGMPAEGRRELPANVLQQLLQCSRTPPNVPDAVADNSNTQFAVLALWVAHRYGVPIDTAVTRVNQYFRGSQHASGGWTYQHLHSDTPSPAMTCAGLIGLAVGQGAFREAARGKPLPDLGKDASIRAGLVALGTTIDHPASRKPGQPRPPVLDPRAHGKIFYFLWSLERVGMIYNLETLGGKDWHAWGSELLVANQQKDGRWVGDFHECGADTCFALLFLVKANPARDLSAALRGTLQDPGEVVLRSGGVNTTGLSEPRLPPALEPQKPGFSATSKPPKDKPPVAPPVDAETARLATRLVEARGERQNELLVQFRDGKGSVYTQALAAAVHRLSGIDRTRAREALAERLTRMSSATLDDKLTDDDLEVRRAAALAVAMKEDKTHVGKLIALLDDPEPPVVRAAYAALKSLSGKDFGPAPEATRDEHTRAVAAWKAWWTRQK